jgi:hypothetical protein
MDKWEHIENCVTLACFLVLAVTFGHWWIILFSVLFMYYPKKRN